MAEGVCSYAFLGDIGLLYCSTYKFPYHRGMQVMAAYFSCERMVAKITGGKQVSPGF
jgi:hypothetical protein